MRAAEQSCCSLHAARCKQFNSTIKTHGGAALRALKPELPPTRPPERAASAMSGVAPNSSAAPRTAAAGAASLQRATGNSEEVD